jgi:hypothetical protein
MASNPYESRFGGLFELGALPVDRVGHLPASSPRPDISPLARSLVDALLAKPALPVATTPLTAGLGDILASPPRFGGGLLASLVEQPPAFGSGFAPTSPPLGGFGSAYVTPPRPTSQPSLRDLIAPPPMPAAKPAVKRKAFFSFHYDDSMRVNVVRNAWKISHPDSATMRSFQDSSLWEAKKITKDDVIKSVIRAGVCFTSAVCVLVGSETWYRRWVRYEIARAIVDKRGLLAVHLNSIRHHKTLTPHTRGPNPLDYMAIGKPQPEPWKPVRYYLYEKNAVPDGVGGYRWEWQRYGDYTQAVDLPGWVSEPAVGFVTPLSENADEYDYMASEGHRNIGSWLDRAAKRAGR